MDSEKKKVNFPLRTRVKVEKQSKEEPMNTSQEAPPPPPSKKAAPPFPPPPLIKKGLKEKEDFGLSRDEEAELEEERQELAKDEIVIEVVKDICDGGFNIWAVLEHDPEIGLNEKEKDRLSKPLTRIAVKYGGAKYLKDEILFGINLAVIIIKRLLRKKKTSEAKDVSDGRGQERIREDDAGKKPNPQQ